MKLSRDIVDFHQQFGLKYDGPPRALPGELSRFRTNFLFEELAEYSEAETLEKKLDALVDLVYVALGTAHLHGFDFDAAWDRVHRANMQKIRGPSVRSGEYDVIKPAGWVAPDLRDLVGE